MELTAYRLRDDVSWPLRPAPRQRAWMDDFTLRWPYRCPPLVMANQAGWQVTCPVGVEAVWNGGPDLGDIEALRPRPPPDAQCASGRGIRSASSSLSTPD